MTNWFGGVVDRAIRTALQTLAAYLSVAGTLDEVTWPAALSAVGLSVVASLLTALVGAPSFGAAWGFQLAERAVKTFAQALLAGIGTAALFDQVDWRTALSAALFAAVYSVVTSVLTTRAGADAAQGQVDVTVPPNRGSHVEAA